MEQQIRRMLIAAMAVVFSSFAGISKGTTAPNVIVVLTDDQGYGDFSCHGNPILKTPNLDKLHGESIRFTDFHSAPVCTPTRGQLLTGRDAMHNGAWAWAFGHEMIHGNNRTMADIFKANGYRTGHFGKWHLGDNYPYRPQEKGFEETIKHGGASTHQTPDYWQNDNFDDFYLHKDGKFRQHKGFCTDVWFDLSMDFMKRCQKKKEPFFLYLPTNAPHYPHYVAESYSSPYKAEKNAANFFGMISNLDENMGRLNAFLEKNQLKENTILIFMTDNGATTGYKIYNAGMRDKKSSYYEGGHRIASFIRWPAGGLGVPRDVDAVSQIQDILPTLMDFCELEYAAKTIDNFDGISLAGLLSGTKTQLPDRKLVVQWSSKDYPDYGRAAVLWGKWRLVHDKELFNIVDDPAQKNNVAKEHPEIVKTLQAHYAQWWETVKPVVSIYSRIGIGGEENPSRLSCFEWTKKSTTAVNVTTQGCVVNGSEINGSWMLDVVESGTYRVELLRYPKEAETAMTAAFPETQREYRKFPACKALPIAEARLQVGDFDESIRVNPADKAAIFEVKLSVGETEMKTWLLDASGNELCGAFYVEVEKR